MRQDHLYGVKQLAIKSYDDHASSFRLTCARPLFRSHYYLIAVPQRVDDETSWHLSIKWTLNSFSSCSCNRDLDEINFNPITFWLKDPCPFLLLLQFLTFPSVPASCILLRGCPLLVSGPYLMRIYFLKTECNVQPPINDNLL